MKSILSRLMLGAATTALMMSVMPLAANAAPDTIVGDAGVDSKTNADIPTVVGNLVLGNQETGDGTYTITGDSSITSVVFAISPNAGSTVDNGGNPPPNGALIVGERGIGTFIQGQVDQLDPGNQVNVAGDLVIGHQGSGSVPSVTDSLGTYVLNIGTLTVDGSIGVGTASTALNSFTQHGGTVNITGLASGNADYVGVGTSDHAGALFLGGAAGPNNDGGNGTYNLNDGTLNTSGLEVGHAGTGSFFQAGGTVNASSILFANANGYGSYTLSGGTINAGSEAMNFNGDSDFFQSGGTNNVTGTLNIGEYQGTATYNLSGGDLNTGGTVVADGTVFALNGSPIGTVTQTGGTHTVTGNLLVGVGANSTGLYDLQDGNLSVSGNAVIGVDGTGTFNQGFVPAASFSDPDIGGDLVLGQNSGSSGTYNIASGPLNIGGKLVVGGNGTGIFTQSGGDVKLTGAALSDPNYVPIDNYPGPGHETDGVGLVFVGSTFNNNGGTGTYTMTGGTLDAPGILVGFTGNGEVVQSSGTVNAQFLNMGGCGGCNGSNSVGIYRLSGDASLTVTSSEDIGQFGRGEFYQTGGTHQVDGELAIATGVSIYKDNGGLQYGDPGYTQPSVQFERSGLYEISGGSLTANSISVGKEGPGVFTQTGGVVTVINDLIIGDHNSPLLRECGDPGSESCTTGGQAHGTYSYDGGTLDVGGQIVVGASGNGTFNQNADLDLTATGTGLVIARDAGSTGTYNLAAGATLIDDLVVGEAGSGTYNNNGGTHHVTADPGNSDPGNLFLGHQAGSDGTYNLNNGGSTTVDGTIFVGDSGKGTFNIVDDGSLLTASNDIVIAAQSTAGGSSMNIGTGTDSPSVTVAANLTVGAGASGSLILNSGAATVTGITYVGSPVTATGIGQVTHNGGTFQSGYLDIGLSTAGNTYTLNDGAVIVDNDLVIGNFAGSGGSLVQKGGTVNVNSVTFGTYINNGTYDLQAGSFTAAGNVTVGDVAGGAKFQQSGATSSASIDYSLILGNNSGVSGVYTLSGGTLDTGLQGDSTGIGDVLIGANGTGEIDNSGGAQTSHSIGGLTLGFYSGSQGTYKLTGTGTLEVAANENIGGFGAGIFEQSGTTTNTVHGTIYMNGGYGGADSSYTLSAGSLVVDGSEHVGFAAKGTFTQTGGTNSVGGDLTLGLLSNVVNDPAQFGDGTYKLSGGSVTVTGFTIVGGAGVGAFTNDGATLTTSNLVLAQSTGSTGDFTVKNGGVVNVGSAAGDFLDIGEHGVATYTQTGGTTTVSGPIDIGRYSDGKGTLALSGGTITAGTFAVVGDEGTGTLTQTGGTFDVTGELDVGRYGGTGIYNLSGSSTVTVGGPFVVGAFGPGGTGTVNQSGGTVTVAAGGSLIVGSSAGVTGIYNLSGGTLNDDAIIGDAGTGTMNTSGGTHNVTGDLVLGNQASGEGTYNLSAGSLGVSNNLVVGNLGKGTFSQTGGTATVTGDVTVKASGAANGSSLSVSSGSLTAAAVTNNDTMTVTGGSVTAPVTNNGQFNFQGGTVNGAVTNNGTMTTNAGGTANLNGSLANSATGTVGVSGSSTLAVTGNVTNAGGVTVAAGSMMDATGNTYTQSAGTTTLEGQIAADQALINGGLLQGNGTVNGDLVNASGRVKPGSAGAPGTMTVTGSFEQQIAAIFEIDLSGTAPAQVSKLDVGGAATLAGTLDVELLNGFTLSLNDVFHIMDFASFSGDFSGFSLNGIACAGGGSGTYNCANLGGGLYIQEMFVNNGTGLELLVAQAGPVDPGNPTGVPEPWTLAVFGAGFGGLGFLRRRRMQRTA